MTDLLDSPPDAATLARLRAEATALFTAGRLEDAERLFQRVLAAVPRDADANRKLGVIAMQAGQFEDGLRLVGVALAVNPSDAETWLYHGTALQNLGRQGEAVASHERALALRPDYPEALFSLGVTLRDLGRFEDALARFDRLVALRTDRSNVYVQRGGLLLRKGEFNAALADYESAITLNSDNAEAWAHRGAVLTEMGRSEEALESFDKALALAPQNAETHYNRGVALDELGRQGEALDAYEEAVKFGPDLPNAWNNRGAQLRRLARFDEALASYQRALAIQPGHGEALANAGAVLQEMGRHGEAMAMFNTLADVQPANRYLLGGLLASAAALCEWKAIDALSAHFPAVAAGHLIVAPLAMIALSSDPMLLRASTGHFLHDKHLPAGRARPTPAAAGMPHEKIRIAYLSGDFREHATASLMAALIERHDRARFEVIGVSFNAAEESPMRARLKAAFDRFHDVEALSDEEVASLLRGLDIDIAIDLKGYTAGARPGIFARRAAPVQVNYLGFPGTMAADFIDYMIADRVLVPPDQSMFYDERIVTLPDSYQPNDPARPIGRTPSRAEAGLPERGLVFSCFNAHFKITEPVFAAWMRLLADVPDSVLWLIGDSANPILRREATERGIDPARLIFAPKLNQAEHLGRAALADLFLDTLPCNAHTTASDALWVGVPLITCKGGSFAGRVAASLLTAIDLPELIAEDLAAYEALALALARDPARLADLRARIAANRLSKPLFDIERYCRHIEAAFATMAETAGRGEAPRPFEVPA